MTLKERKDANTLAVVLEILVKLDIWDHFVHYGILWSLKDHIKNDSEIVRILNHFKYTLNMRKKPMCLHKSTTT